jgi:hypothetical protein
MVFNSSAKILKNRFLNRSNIFSIEVLSKGDFCNKPNSILNHEQTKKEIRPHHDTIRGCLFSAYLGDPCQVQSEVESKVGRAFFVLRLLL